ncbi:conserved protein of unknown function [Pseudomonas marincola]|uniref:Uncharacterized protein n=1 Tax=Pseudomonas marincola TaxID=437900 RepID=A0A653EA18_9PSED|nr:conserved protein of unknown function [Pseudomonas marincola]
MLHSFRRLTTGKSISSTKIALISCLYGLGERYLLLLKRILLAVIRFTLQRLCLKTHGQPQR